MINKRTLPVISLLSSFILGGCATEYIEVADSLASSHFSGDTFTNPLLVSEAKSQLDVIHKIQSNLEPPTESTGVVIAQIQVDKDGNVITIHTSSDNNMIARSVEEAIYRASPLPLSAQFLESNNRNIIKVVIRAVTP